MWVMAKPRWALGDPFLGCFGEHPPFPADIFTL